MKFSYLPACSFACFAAALVGTFAFSLAPADAAPPSNWRVLASQTVATGSSRTTIRIPGSNRYRQIQLCTRNAPIRLSNYTFRFDNGRQQSVRVNSRINTGGCSRAINLTNPPRRIDRVDLAYQPIPRGTRAPQIRVVGR
ncbi:hypothetical protein EDF58_10620 [Novosphingobium sp. PhB57]|uniref:hypothetical protein n=1 Tax=Novosphingobium sp. PhB57 TaxID=2485107 RepID=UPI00104C838B|nr:hypothetical protein [Novosphingobium sp. PhB57]TCU55735.1 hypothetical protein EDF58_10620 [Novosphingobium sp. PhB57]